MVNLLKVVEYELADRQIVIHFGWPLSSWLDRIAVGVMVFNLMRLPRLFPQFEFDIRYFRRPPDAPPPLPPAGRAECTATLTRMTFPQKYTLAPKTRMLESSRRHPARQSRFPA